MLYAFLLSQNLLLFSFFLVFLYKHFTIHELSLRIKSKHKFVFELSFKGYLSEKLKGNGTYSNQIIFNKA